MRKTLLIIAVLMLVVGCSSPEPINIDELVKKGDIFYTKDTNKPYSGPVFSLYENGQKKEGTLKNGKEDGLLTAWYENGQKKSEETYKDGELDGRWTAWDESGQKKWVGTYKDGAVISEKCWDEDGNEIDCP